jgi:hypothetical protein
MLKTGFTVILYSQYDITLRSELKSGKQPGYLSQHEGRKFKHSVYKTVVTYIYPEDRSSMLLINVGSQPPIKLHVIHQKTIRNNLNSPSGLIIIILNLMI